MLNRMSKEMDMSDCMVMNRVQTEWNATGYMMKCKIEIAATSEY